MLHSEPPMRRPACDARRSRLPIPVPIRRGAAALLLAAAGAAGWGEEPMAGAWSLSGRVAVVIHAHPLLGDRGGDAVYIDADEGGQVVAYVRGAKPREGAWVRLAGRAVEFEASARPGGRQFRARQLDADSWSALAARDEVEELVRRLGGAPAGDRAPLQGRILDAGLDAFPVLIAHLGDARVYERRDVQNYMGLPARGPRPEPLYADVTVGSVCADLLHRLLTPRYRSPHERVFKPRGDMFIVRDWPAWWRRNHAKTLAQIHKELEPLVDEHFRSGGDPQVIDKEGKGLAGMLGREVTLVGKAADEKLGAVLLTEHGAVWIDGLDSWPADVSGKRLRVKGRLIERADLPVFEMPAPGEPQKSGIPVPPGTDLREAARRLLLSQPSWEPEK